MSQSILDPVLPGAVTGSLGKAVNRSLPDSDVDQTNSNSGNNRSIMQRVLHLVHDANNSKFCNKDGAKITSPIPLPGTYLPCELMQIDDLAMFYLISIADLVGQRQHPRGRLHQRDQERCLAQRPDLRALSGR